MATVGLTAALADWVEAKPVFPPPRDVELPDVDDEADASGGEIGYAEGQTFMIEYVDGAGKRSRRRITVWHIEKSGRDQVPALYAKCHERNAMRMFRVDRIAARIDYDGVVHEDVPAFLSDSFGMSLPMARAKENPDGRRWNLIVGAIRTETVLLSAMARCDGHMVASEIETILVYLAKRVERSGPMLLDSDISRIDQYVSRPRPTPRSIAAALAEASQFDPDEIRHLLIAAARVMDADEARHPAEVRLLNLVARELLGTTLF